MGFCDTLLGLLLYTCLPVACNGRLSDLLASRDILRTLMTYSVPKVPSYSQMNMPQFIRYNHAYNSSFMDPATQEKIYKLLFLQKSADRIVDRRGRIFILKDTPYMPMSKRLNTDNFERASIEILLVIDNSIYRRFLREQDFKKDVAKRKIVQYFNIVFAMVDERYQTFTDAKYSIRISICDMAIAETRRDASWIEFLSKWSTSRQNSVVPASRALKRFQKWLRKNKSVLRYDHAVLATSYILSRKRQQVDGLAYVGTMCKTKFGKSASIIHDSGDFQSVGIIAHELAHSLGVQHDGTWKSKVCPGSDNYIMAPQVIHEPSVARNSFRFSTCSVKQMKTFLRSSQSKCLENKPRKLISYDLPKYPPGDLFDADDQCKKAFGDEAYFCDQSVARSSMCSRLWCVSPQESDNMCRSSNRLSALPGTSCGVGQHCQLGECVAKSRQFNSLESTLYSRINVRDDHCPLGDGNPAHCQGLILASPHLCDNPKLREYCCDSCDNLNS